MSSDRLTASGFLGRTALAVLIGLSVIAAWAPESLGDIVFGPGTAYPATNPRSVTILDHNRDLRPDFAVTLSDSDSVRIYLNTGSSFMAGPSFKTPYRYPRAIAAGDLDGNGCEDLVMCTSDSILVIRFDAAGTPTVSTYQQGGTPWSTGIVDIDHDNDLDLVFGLFWSYGVKFMINGGLGDFAYGPFLYDFGHVSQMSAADFNEDGHVDLVTNADSQTRINILYGNGTGSFSLTWFEAPTTSAVESADFDLDGHADIVGSTGSGYLIFYWGDGRGGFVGPTVVGGFGGGGYLTLADFNRDGLQDVVMASHFFPPQTVVENLGGRQFYARSFDVGNGGCSQFAAADFDGDGWPDLVCAKGSPYDFVLVLRNETGPVGLPGDPVNAPKGLRAVVAPNPTMWMARVFASGMNQEGVLTVLDLHGRIVERRVLTESDGASGVWIGGGARWPVGIYVVRIRSGGREASAKLIIAR